MISSAKILLLGKVTSSQVAERSYGHLWRAIVLPLFQCLTVSVFMVKQEISLLGQSKIDNGVIEAVRFRIAVVRGEIELHLEVGKRDYVKTRHPMVVSQMVMSLSYLLI